MSEENKENKGTEAIDALKVEMAEMKKLLESAQSTINSQSEDIVKLRDGAGKPNDDEKSGAAEKEAKANAEKAEQKKGVDYKEKAASIYQSLTAEERAEAEKQMSEMDKDFVALVSNSDEGRHAFLSRLFPDKEGGNSTGGFFDDLAKPVEKKSVAELLEEMVNKKVGKGPVNQSSSKSGFTGVKRKKEEVANAGRSSEKPDIAIAGIYGN